MNLTVVAAALWLAAAPAPRKEILGTWKGTSKCVDVQKHPACKDEVVIYEFREKNDDPGKVVVRADKIVDGQRQPMGELDCTWDAARKAWVAEYRNPKVHILFRYVVKGDKIDGTLVDLPGENLIRRIAVRKQ